MDWTIEFSPFLPPVALWACAILAFAALLPHLMQRRRGALIRLAALALLVLALANPTLKREDRESLPNIALVVIDGSTSQKIAGRAELTEAARARLEKALSDIENLEVRWVYSSGEQGSEREETRLFADLNRGLADVPVERLAGVFLITDGQVHDVPPAGRLGFDAPVHAVLTGRPGEFDRRIKVVSAPRFGMIDSEQTAEIKVVSSGADKGSGATASLTIRRENEPEETREVAIGETIKLPFRFRHAGRTYLELALAPAEGELTEANNRIVLEAEGIREHLRVLLVSGEPHIGERTWRNLLRSDAAVDLVHFTILRPPEKQDGTPINQLSLIAFPTRELFSEKLNDFDLIIFDRYQRRGVLPLIYLDNVTRYIAEGGAVLVAAGPDFASPLSLYRTPLANSLPARPTGRIIETPYRPRVTKTGTKHPVTASLPGVTSATETPKWGRWFRLIDVEKVDGEILMTGPEGKPLLVLARKGKGRVAMFLSDHAWLWARGYDGGGPHAAIFRRLAHWLMKEPDLEEESLSATADRGSLTITRHSMEDKVGPATVITPAGEVRSVKLQARDNGEWRASIAAQAPGLYRVTMGNLSAVAHVGAVNSRELMEVAATDTILKPVLQATGGGAFWMRGADGEATEPNLPRLTVLRNARKFHGPGWAGLKDREAYVVRSVSFIPLFSGALALAFLLGVVVFAWYRESR